MTTEPWHDQVLMVIPSIDGGSLLSRMLPTVRHRPSSVVVLDQGSRDDTEAVCQAAGVELVQLGRPHTYTEACNIGASLAKQRGFPFVCLANNDITFRTQVLRDLYLAMQADPALGMVAPSQLVRDPLAGRELLSNRVYWNLERVEFAHDLEPVPPGVERLEADFCELTCALVRIGAIDRLGFLDDEYGFYHEDADFGFRLRQAGFSCAYLPRTQIVHYTSSTFAKELSARKRDYIARNKRQFAAKHLGYAVRLPHPARADPLHATLRHHGLLDPAARGLAFGNPGLETDGYLMAPATNARLPQRWAKHASRYRAVFTRSDAVRDAFLALGYPQVHTVPSGIDPDLYHPWNDRSGPGPATTYLVLCSGWNAGPLAAFLAGWRHFAATHPDAQLVLLGRGLRDPLGQAPDSEYVTHRAHVAHHPADRVTVHDLLSPMDPAEEAAMFHAADFALVLDDDPESAAAALKLAACGVPSIDPPGQASGLLATLEAAAGLGPQARQALGLAAAYRVRATATLRHTAMGLHAALARLQIRDPAPILARLERRELDVALAEGTPLPMIAERRSGAAAARRLVTAGRLATQFGTSWQQDGLSAASRSVATELRYFVSSRARRPATPPRMPETLAKQTLPPPSAASDERLAPSPLLIGYIDAQLGLGQSLRGLATALARVQVDFQVCPVGIGVEGRRTVPFMPDRIDPAGAHAVNVIEVTCDELPAVLAHVGAYRVRHSYNILRTYWELGRAPPAWRRNLVGIHEIWAPNAFVATSLQTVFDGPVTLIPPCLDIPGPEAGGHAMFGLDPGAFHFLFSFDYFSFPERKNPLAVIRAFRKAFPDLATPAALVLKASGAAEHYPEVKRALQEASFLDGRIHVIDESLTRTELLALLTAADCYVSLHRAEGFGLGMAEAMALGKPVIATDYSGSTDFLSPATGFPIPMQLRPVGSAEYVHAEDQVWADPDEAAAAAAMRHVFDHREAAAAIAQAGQAFVRQRYGAANVGALAAARLAAIAAPPPQPAA